MTGYGGNPFDVQNGGDPFTGGSFAGGPAGPPAPRDDRRSHTETDTLATLSMVFAFVFAPAGAILGHLALGRIRSSGQRGRNRALAGTTLSYVVITGLVVPLIVWAAGGDDAPAIVAVPTPATLTPTTSAPSTTAAPTTTTTTVAPPPPPPKVDQAALPDVLLPIDVVQRVSNDPGQTAVFQTFGLVEPRPELGTYDDTSCLGSYARGTPMGYQDNEPVAYVGADSVNANPGRKAGLQIRQGAALFADDAAARKAFDGYVEAWRNCVGKSTRFTPDTGPRSTFVYGAPEELAPGMMAVRTRSPELSVVKFIHVIAVKSNVLVDDFYGGLEPGDIPVNVTQAMLDRIAT